MKMMHGTGTQRDEVPHSPTNISSTNITNITTSHHALQLNMLEQNNIQLEEHTSHNGTLREMESKAEEYVLALIKEPNPFRYIGSLIYSQFTQGSTSFPCHSFVTSKHKTPPESPLVASKHSASLSWKAVLSIILLKSLLLFARLLETLGNTLEYFLNMVNLNQGLCKTMYRCTFDRDALKRPHQEDEDYYCILGLIDPREDLHVQEDVLSDVFNFDTDVGIKSIADICVMASKIAYENEKVIRKVVEKKWKMNFVQFFDCWNDYLEYNATQAFIFTDKKKDANLIVVAFRGTQPFNMYDWCTDFDFSYYELPGVGQVHVGFLEALGLGSRIRTDTLKQAKINTIMKASGKSPVGTPSSGLPERVINDDGKVLAYDAICATMRTLLRENLGAKLYITGHSLGGALATVFSGLLLIEGDAACSSLGGIFTFGQPRVGDAKFASFMETFLCGPNKRKYFRVVYRTDIVPRVPFDDWVFQFKHISPCHYYLSCSESKVLFEEPYSNFWLMLLLPMPHFSALRELFESLCSRFRRGQDGVVETGLYLVVRLLALLYPGLCAHFPSCYISALRNAPMSFLVQPTKLEKRSWLSLKTLPRLLKWPRFTKQEHLH